MGQEFPSINKLFLVSLGEKHVCNYDSSCLQALEVWGETGYWFLSTSAQISSLVICWNHFEWRFISKVHRASGITAAFKHNIRKMLRAESVLVSSNSLTLCCPFFFFSFSVTDHVLHAAVSCVCDAQPGGLHPLLPERSAGQLSGRLSAGETNWTLTLSGFTLCFICVGEKYDHLNKSLNLAVNFWDLKTSYISLTVDEMKQCSWPYI